MKLVLTLAVMLSFSVPAFADWNEVDGYYRNNGTYVNSYTRDTSNDGIQENNVSYARSRGWSGIKANVLD